MPGKRTSSKPSNSNRRQENPNPENQNVSPEGTNNFDLSIERAIQATLAELETKNIQHLLTSLLIWLFFCIILSVSVQNNLRKIFYFGLAFFIISAISAALTQNLPSYTELDHRSEEVIPPSQSVEPASALQMAETRLREANRNKEYYTKISNILEIFLKIFTVFDFIWYVTTTEGSLLHPLMLVKVYFLTQVIKSTSDLRYKSHFSYEISQNTLQSFLAEITALQIKASLKKYGQLQCISVRAFPNHPPLESNETKEIFYKTLQSCGGEHVNELIIICPTDNEEFKNQLTSLRAGQAIETKSATNSAYR